MTNENSGTTKEKVLLAAMALFSGQGFSGVSMRDIASEVGISPPALYNHFANKDALYRAAVSHAFADKELRLLSAMAADVHPLVRLERFVHAVTDELEQDDTFRRLLQRELLDANDERMAFLGEFIFNQVQKPFMQLLGEIKPGCDALLLSEMIFGMLKQYYEMNTIHPFIAVNQSCHRSAEHIAQIAMTVLRPYFEGDS